MEKKHINAIVVLLVAAIVLQGVYAINSNSPTFDEPSYVIQGVAQLQSADFDLGKGNPPLMKYFAGVLPYLAGIRLPEGHENGFDKENAIEFQTVFKSGMDSKQLIFLSRLPTLILTVLTALLVFVFGRKMYGEKAALFSLFLFAFSPIILAHGTLATLDMGTAFFTFLSMYLFWGFFDRPTYKSFALMAFSTGLAISSKMAGTHLLAMYAMILAIAHLKRMKMPKFGKLERMRGAKYGISLFVLLLLIAGFVVLATYMFKIGAIYPKGINKYVPDSGIFGNATSIGKAVHFALEDAIVPFNFYIRDIALQFIHQKDPQVNYIFGEMHTSGIWHYYLVAVLVKSPLPFAVFLAFALLSLSKFRLKFKEHFLLVPIAFILLYFSFLVPINTGVRYVLSMMPFIFVFIGRVLLWLGTFELGKNIKPAAAIGAALCIWYAVSTIAAAPFYIPYFNEIAGGSDNGYRILSQSDLDWGQADFALNEYMQKNNIPSIKYSYSGSVPPKYYGFNYELLPSGFGRGGEDCSEKTGLMAISATNLNGNLFKNHDCYKWLREKEPIAKIGHVIFIYDLKN
ncbi:phospholipid carrier-dependent glycosyltransferase [Candidatus Micrarchaeota archaeon]|nr:phospholipid carrier-dependent glycosyltransferase [Candidatus Micrarchaeota archaeon]